MAKQGSPFGPFWDNVGVDFAGDRAGPYPYTDPQAWARFPPARHAVIAMKGAPARFPAEPAHRQLARYVRWSARMNKTADE